MKNVEIVGCIKFGNYLLNVYDSLDNPLFLANEIADILGYSHGNTWNLAACLEDDEKLVLPAIVGGQRRNVIFVNENGLYNILAQSKMLLARKWRRVVHDELIELRKSNGRNIVDQFEYWDHKLDGYFFDEETNTMMKSVTVVGGDVIQVPLGEEE